MYGFIAEINDCYPPKIVSTCSFLMVTKCISSLKKLFLHYLSCWNHQYYESSYNSCSLSLNCFQYCKTFLFFSNLGLFAKELSSTIIEFLCIALLEVKNRYSKKLSILLSCLVSCFNQYV